MPGPLQGRHAFQVMHLTGRNHLLLRDPTGPLQDCMHLRSAVTMRPWKRRWPQRRSTSFSFVQFTYNILDREAEQRLLPLAAERGMAVIINRPFQRGALFERVQGKPLAPWAAEFDCHNWAQFLLKFIVSYTGVQKAEAGVTCMSIVLAGAVAP
jgi:aryl-alcohol dehydrogenase-like predicted oxidoreductase